MAEGRHLVSDWFFFMFWKPEAFTVFTSVPEICSSEMSLNDIIAFHLLRANFWIVM